MIISALYFTISLYIATGSVHDNTCRCLASSPNGVFSFCAETDNECSGANEVCPCSQRNDAQCTTNNINVPCITADFNGASSNTCTCRWADGFGCFANENNGCSATEVCPCSKKGGVECNSFPTATCAPVVTDGAGDPHFLGFDHKKFDFHGVHGNSYLVYAEEKGDIFTAKVRATPENFNGYNKTYFHEFGLQSFGSPQKIHFFLAQIADRTWGVHVTVNYKHVTSNTSLQSYELAFNNDGTSVTATTRKNKFTIKGVSLSSKFRRHLDFKLKKGPIGKSEKYSGVLGMTLSRRLGSSIHEEVVGSGREKQFEMKMRQHYGVNTIFPSKAQISHMF